MTTEPPSDSHLGSSGWYADSWPEGDMDYFCKALQTDRRHFHYSSHAPSSPNF